MNKDEDFVYRIIRACGSSTANSDINIFALERIIEDIKAEEREASAKLCEEQYEYYGFDHIFAAKIRERGKPQRPVKSYTNGEPQYATEDMSTKPQNVYTSEERVHEIDISIHEDDDIQEYKKPWVGLTDGEIDYLEDAIDPAMYRVFARRIEAKLKEKNNG